MIDTGRVLNDLDASAFVGRDITDREKTMGQRGTTRLRIVL